MYIYNIYIYIYIYIDIWCMYIYIIYIYPRCNRMGGSYPPPSTLPKKGRWKPRTSPLEFRPNRRPRAQGRPPAVHGHRPGKTKLVQIWVTYEYIMVISIIWKKYTLHNIYIYEIFKKWSLLFFLNFCYIVGDNDRSPTMSSMVILQTSNKVVHSACCWPVLGCILGFQLITCNGAFE